MSNKVPTLFLGGPLHEQFMPLDTSLRHYVAIDDPHAFVGYYRPNDPRATDRLWSELPTVVYRREHVAVGSVDKARSVMVLGSISTHEAERMLINYLCRRWVEESPDAR